MIRARYLCACNFMISLDWLRHVSSIIWVLGDIHRPSVKPQFILHLSSESALLKEKGTNTRIIFIIKKYKVMYNLK